MCPVIHFFFTWTVQQIFFCLVLQVRHGMEIVHIVSMISAKKMNMFPCLLNFG